MIQAYITGRINQITTKSGATEAAPTEPPKRRSFSSCLVQARSVAEAISDCLCGFLRTKLRSNKVAHRRPERRFPDPVTLARLPGRASRHVVSSERLPSANNPQNPTGRRDAQCARLPSLRPPRPKHSGRTATRAAFGAFRLFRLQTSHEGGIWRPAVRLWR